MKILLVDDEPLALGRLEHLLKHQPGIELVGSCADGEQALAQSIHAQPDLVLLDIKMPGQSGFEVADALRQLDHIPEIVFVTAFDHYAIQAFEAHALDYLLKPVEKDRLLDSIQLAETRIRERDSSARSDELGVIIKDLREALGDHQRDENKRALWVKEKGRMVRIKNADIEWIEAERDYIRLHIGQRSHLMRNTMNAISHSLISEKFVRVHRSAIVNVDFVEQFHLSSTGAHVLCLRNGVEVPVGRSYRKKVSTALHTKA
jgi:two-component system, LytTR family, response regulator